MECSNITISEAPAECGVVSLNIKAVFYDPETGAVYDEDKNFIGYGVFTDGFLQITRE